MKLLSVTVPCYNSQEYMEKAIQSLICGGNDVEVIIVDDGSTDRTAQIADEYARQYPEIVRVIHKGNGGHGDAIMAGLQYAKGLYFKVVDSDDWLDSDGFQKTLKTLHNLQLQPVDMVISNYLYNKNGVKRPYAMQYRKCLPIERVFGWNDIRPFGIGQCMLMHSVIYRTALLRQCGLQLPKHTFYVDELYVYLPLRYVQSMYYLNLNLYHYYIGREDQSVQEKIMIERIDQALYVNRLLISAFDPYECTYSKQREYLQHYLGIITMVSSTLLIKSGTTENLQKKKDLWSFIQTTNPTLYRNLRTHLFGRLFHLPPQLGGIIVKTCYKLSRRFIGFN